MPPKARITREDITATALALVREKGEGAINARAIANSLQCSTQPVFSNFANMESLRESVIKRLLHGGEGSRRFCRGFLLV